MQGNDVKNERKSITKCKKGMNCDLFDNRKGIAKFNRVQTDWQTWRKC